MLQPLRTLVDGFEPMDRERFAAACRSICESQDGRVLLNGLLSFANPLVPPARDSVLDTGQAIGRAEVVSLLLGLGCPEQAATLAASHT